MFSRIASYRKRFVAATLLCAGLVLPAEAQTLPQFSFGEVVDNTDGVSVTVELTRVRDARTVDVQVVGRSELVRWTGAEYSGEFGAMQIVYQNTEGDTMRVVLSHTDPVEGSTSLRRKALVTLRGERLAGGEVTYTFAEAEPAVVSPTLVTQNAVYDNVYVVDVEDAEMRVPFGLAGVWPNPSAGERHLAFDAPVAGLATVQVYDAVGRRVGIARGVPFAPGRNALAVPLPAGASAGLYAFRVDVTDGSAPRAFTGTFIQLR